MTIIGFNFSKIVADHTKPAKGNLKVSTNVKLTAVDKTNLNFDGDKGAIRASFTYTVGYEPNIGSVELGGDIIFMQDKKTISAILDEWDKKKALPKKLSQALINAIMQKSVVQAMIVTKDIGLPPPMALPKIKSSAKVKAPEEAQTKLDAKK